MSDTIDANNATYEHRTAIPPKSKQPQTHHVQQPNNDEDFDDMTPFNKQPIPQDHFQHEWNQDTLPTPQQHDYREFGNNQLFDGHGTQQEFEGQKNVQPRNQHAKIAKTTGNPQEKINKAFLKKVGISVKENSNSEESSSYTVTSKLEVNMQVIDANEVTSQSQGEITTHVLDMNGSTFDALKSKALLLLAEKMCSTGLGLTSTGYLVDLDKMDEFNKLFDFSTAVSKDAEEEDDDFIAYGTLSIKENSLEEFFKTNIIQKADSNTYEANKYQNEATKLVHQTLYDGYGKQQYQQLVTRLGTSFNDDDLEEIDTILILQWLISHKIIQPSNELSELLTTKTKEAQISKHAITLSQAIKTLGDIVHRNRFWNTGENGVNSLISNFSQLVEAKLKLIKLSNSDDLEDGATLVQSAKDDIQLIWFKIINVTLELLKQNNMLGHRNRFTALKLDNTAESGSVPTETIKSLLTSVAVSAYCELDIQDSLPQHLSDHSDSKNADEIMKITIKGLVIRNFLLASAYYPEDAISTQDLEKAKDYLSAFEQNSKVAGVIFSLAKDLKEFSKKADDNGSVISEDLNKKIKENANTKSISFTQRLRMISAKNQTSLQDAHNISNSILSLKPETAEKQKDDRINELNKKFMQLQEAKTGLEQQLKQAEQENETLTQEKDQQTAELEQANKEKATLTQERDQLTAELEQANEDKGNLTQERDQQTAELEQANKEKATLTQERDQLTAELEQANEDKGNLTQERDQQTAELEQANKEKATLTQENEKLTAELNQTKTALQKAEEQSKAALEQANKEKVTLTQENGKLTAELAQAKATLDKAKQENVKVTAEDSKAKPSNSNTKKKQSSKDKTKTKPESEQVKADATQATKEKADEGSVVATTPDGGTSAKETSVADAGLFKEATKSQAGKDDQVATKDQSKPNPAENDSVVNEVTPIPKA